MVPARIVLLFTPRLIKIKYRGAKRGFSLNLVNMVRGVRVISSHNCITFEQDVLKTGSVLLKYHVNLLLLSPGYTKVDISLIDSDDQPILKIPIKILFDGIPRPWWMLWN
jgi:hypothetical protein